MTAPRSRARRRPHPRARGQIGAELLLVLVTLVAVSGFTRLFADDAAIIPLLVAALVAHAIGIVARHRGLGSLGTIALTAGALALQVSIVLYPHVSLAGLPTGATVSAMTDDLGRAWELFADVQAPVPSTRGFLLAATIAVWLAASLSDWAGFRLRATAEAVLPASALFVFTALLGRGASPVLSAAALAALVLGFAAAQRAARSTTEDTWVGGRAPIGAAALGRAGLVVAVVAASVAGGVVPHLPGTHGDPLVGWRSDGQGSNRTTISPLVNIRTRLVQQSEAVAFQVRADRPAYWRLTSLDRFNGEVWSLRTEKFDDADGDLPSEPPTAATDDLVQTFTIRNLDTLWAPAALTPVDLQASTTDLRWNRDLATLIVEPSVEDIDGARYQVRSRVPQFTSGDLTAPLPTPLPPDLAAATAVPPGMPTLVSDLAREATRTAGPTPYAQARALQDWFREQFTYDLAGVSAGHGTTAIEAFLLARRGYCEQFAGAYAAMARTLGLPARVAVGFTPGEVDASGVYTVRGRNAHAWPEVFIPGAGWVPFEPTPGRGQPGTRAYTGVEPAQDEGAGPPPPTTTTDSAAVVDPGAPTTTPRPPTTPPALDTDPLVPPTDPDTSDGRGRWIAIAAVLLGGAAVLDVAGLAAVRARRRRRRRRITGVPARVRAAWADAVEATTRLGGPRLPAETDTEYAARAAPTLGAAAPALTQLAGLSTRALWSPPGADADPALATEADQLARQVGDEARRRLTVKQRLRALIDPRPELRPQ